MTAVRRKFSVEQKIEILRAAEKQGIHNVLRQHNLSYSVFSRWRQNMTINDPEKEELIASHKARAELKRYITENSRLKKIIAHQALELERKNEELRRKPLKAKG